MIYGSVCSGIEAATAAWHPLGWKPAFFSDIEKFPRAVLKHHYCDVPPHGDFTTIGKSDYEPIDLLVGGTPCQSFSIAGLRKGMDDERGNLALEYLKLAQRLRPTWLVWENVPGVLSSSGGRDFGAFLGGLGELGYGFAYRILDAQYFGVPQRRRRVFVVGYLGDWRPAAAVLFERHSLQGHPAPSREKGQEVAPTIRSGAPNGGPGHGARSGNSKDELIVTVQMGNNIAHTLRGEGFDASEDGTGRGTPIVPTTHRMRGFGDYALDEVASTVKSRDAKDLISFPSIALPINTQIATRHKQMGKGTGFGIGWDGDPAFTLQSAHSHAVAFAQNSRDEVRYQGGDGQVVGALSAEPGMKQTTYVKTNMAVRRLTPTECERLQGFEDGYTLILGWSTRNPKDLAGIIPYIMQAGYFYEEACDLACTPDGTRYKALGNSMAVPVMRWIGQRINAVEEILKEQDNA